MAAGKSVSLVLGGGGARGYAHFGVIRWLLANQFEIRSVTGCSMGALVGGVFAAGKLDECMEWALSLRRRDIVRMIDPSLFSEGLLKGERLMNQLREVLGDWRIEDLPVKYSAVATDLDAEVEVWFTSGSLFEAIRASIAVPTVFTPVMHGEHRLLDGGLLNPLPMEHSVDEDTDLTVAVELFGRPDPRLDDESTLPGDPAEDGDDRGRRPGWKLKGPFDLFPRAIETMQCAITNLKVETNQPDVLIPVPRNAASFYDFHRAPELVPLGYQLAENALRRFA